jgi:DHA1 family tetracycline resistance protein-like MFS transporter
MSQRRSLAIIFLIIFVNLIGFGIVIPLLPFYGESMGATELQIGLLFASYSVCQILASPILGSLSDRFGRRPVLLFSLLGTVVSFAMLGTATTLFWLFAARIVDGLSGGNISTARAYISDITAEKDRSMAYGLIGAAFGLGFVFGPVLGGLLGAVDPALPAWTAAGLAGVALIATYLWLPETNQSRGGPRTNPRRAMPGRLRTPVLGRLLMVDFLYWSAFAVYQTTFTLFAARRFDWGYSEVGLVLGYAGLVGAIVQGGVVRLVVKRIGDKRTMVLGLFLAALGFGSAAFAYSWPLFLLALTPAAIGAGLANPTVIALISQRGRQVESGQVQGVASALESLGRVIGPLWGNGLLGFFGEGAAYGSAGLALFFVALLGLGVKEEEEERESERVGD